jgi:hypothetical protein
VIHCNDNLRFLKQLENSFQNELYGQSVLKGVQVVDSSAFELRRLKNGVLESIIEMKSTNAGFYTLLNVRMSLFTYCDIEILVDESVSKKPGFEAL